MATENQRPISERKFAVDHASNPRFNKKETGAVTKQEFKKDCDINIIMKNYRNTGELSHVREYLGWDAKDNYPSMTEYQEMHDLVLEADAAFAELPSELRTRLDNEPAKFLEWIDDPENRQEAIDMKILPPVPREPKPPVEETPEAPTPTPEQDPASTP